MWFYMKIHRKQKPCRQKLLSDKQIKFKELCVSWNKFHKNLPRDSFKIFVWKNVVLYVYSKKIEGDGNLTENHAKINK
jgi:hypothetical protein